MVCTLTLNNKLLTNFVLRMTYRLAPVVGSYTVMIPDFVLWVEPHSEVSFEVFFFVEAKKQGNFSNGPLESDLVKLGKEMQLGLKLIKTKVANPEVVGLLLEGSLLFYHYC